MENTLTSHLLTDEEILQMDIDKLLVNEEREEKRGYNLEILESTDRRRMNILFEVLEYFGGRAKLGSFYNTPAAIFTFKRRGKSGVYQIHKDKIKELFLDNRCKTILRPTPYGDSLFVMMDQQILLDHSEYIE